jgi:hypothetical protein
VEATMMKIPVIIVFFLGQKRSRRHLPMGSRLDRIVNRCINLKVNGSEARLAGLTKSKNPGGCGWSSLTKAMGVFYNLACYAKAMKAGRSWKGRPFLKPGGGNLPSGTFDLP